MPALPTRPLGRNGPQVTALGFGKLPGAMGLSAFYGTPKPDNERFAVLDRAYELGELNWDSSDIYGDNEVKKPCFLASELLRAWFKANPDRRKNIFLATKFAIRVVDGQRKIDSSAEYVKQACETSLKRLGLPFVDLYYCHRMDGKTPIEKTVEAMAELKSQGKIKHLGLSECSAETLRRAHKVHPISAVQLEYSPWTLDIEKPQIGLLQTCRELGIAVVAYSPIGRGMLSGAIKSPDDFEDGDARKRHPRFSTENFPKNLDIVRKIELLAKKKGCTSSQLTLAWLMAQGEDIIPIPGTTKVERLDENMDSLKISLSKEEIAEVREVCDKADISGARYDEAMMAATFADTPPLDS